MTYLDKNLSEIKDSLNSGEVTSESLIEEAATNIDNTSKSLNAFVTNTKEYAIEQMNNLSSIEENILKGIPYALKDNFSTKGVLTTASSNILADYVPVYDATIVKKLHEKGALMVGKTVLDELAMGGSGTTGHTGAVKNPWDTNRLIGGSSAGSSASVAAGIVPYAIGSDTGDSIRKPACYGGVVGYKPTYGLVSRYGLFAFASSLDHVGCFTRCVEDVAYVIDAIKGEDKLDMTSIDSSDINLTKDLTRDVNGKKLFYIKEIMDESNYTDCMDDNLKAIFSNFKEVLSKCEEIGIKVEEVSFDIELLKAIFPTYITISCAEVTSNNSNLTGIIFGPREKGNNINEIMFNSRTKGFSELIKRRFVLGSYILQKENQERLFLNAGRVRRLIVDKMTQLFKEYDGLILPASGDIAPTFIEESINKLSNRYLLLENHLAIGNFGGFPSITIPSGLVEGMPIAVNITSGIKHDQDVLNIAYALEEKIGFKSNTGVK